MVKGDHEKAAADMAKVLEHDHIVAEDSRPKTRAAPGPSYGLLSREFLQRLGLHLLGTTSTWFLLDVAFYSLQLTQKDIYPATGLVPKASSMNATEEVYKISKAMLLVLELQKKIK